MICHGFFFVVLLVFSIEQMPHGRFFLAMSILMGALGFLAHAAPHAVDLLLRIRRCRPFTVQVEEDSYEMLN